VFIPLRNLSRLFFGTLEEQVLGFPSSASLLTIQLLLSPRQQRWWKERFIPSVKQPAREELKGDYKTAEEEGMRYSPSPAAPAASTRLRNPLIQMVTACSPGPHMGPGSAPAPVSTVPLAFPNRVGQPQICTVPGMLQEGGCRHASFSCLCQASQQCDRG